MSQESAPINPRSKAAPSFTLVEILISILILALGVLGLGALFPVIIREQRLGADATSGVSASNSARAMLTEAEWGSGLVGNGGAKHPVLQSAVTVDGLTPTEWLWAVLRDGSRYTLVPPIRPQDGLGRGYDSSNVNRFQRYGQGEWFTALIDLQTGAAKIGFPNITNGVPVSPATKVKYGNPTSVDVFGCVDLPVSARLFPTGGLEPQFVWDFAVQRVTDFDHTHRPDWDDLRAVVFVRRIDQRLRAAGSAASILDAITNVSGTVILADRRFPVGEDMNGNPTLDGTDGLGALRYSGIKTCEVDFYFNPANPAMSRRDRLYVSTAWAGQKPAANVLALMWAQMKQPGQKLVDNLGNVYTVTGYGNEPGVTGSETFDGVAGADYLRIDPPVPESVTQERSAAASGGRETNVYSNNSGYATRAIRQVAFTPQIPVSVTLVEVAKGIKP